MKKLILFVLTMILSLCLLNRECLVKATPPAPTYYGWLETYEEKINKNDNLQIKISINISKYDAEDIFGKDLRGYFKISGEVMEAISISKVEISGRYNIKYEPALEIEFDDVGYTKEEVIYVDMAIPNTAFVGSAGCVYIIIEGIGEEDNVVAEYVRTKTSIKVFYIVREDNICIYEDSNIFEEEYAKIKGIYKEEPVTGCKKEFGLLMVSLITLFTSGLIILNKKQN